MCFLMYGTVFAFFALINKNNNKLCNEGIKGSGMNA